MTWGVRTRALTARKTHRCSKCGRFILGEHRYLRHTFFPGHDANTTAHPIAELECVPCVAERDESAPMLEADACSRYCHGVDACVLPFRHAGEYWCREDTSTLTYQLVRKEQVDG
jgi:hypothetical protein